MKKRRGHGRMKTEEWGQDYLVTQKRARQRIKMLREAREDAWEDLRRGPIPRAQDLEELGDILHQITTGPERK
jgi:hypothetical protein